ncbi:hypothetical protein LCGC14_0145880 [marine sediment metagenome]|uniref:Uncharacterized protein n=1 Tax=marine sediment metagenome TaxID=412755 RepID=A0A0F9VFB7_9ZZZZ
MSRKAHLNDTKASERVDFGEVSVSFHEELTEDEKQTKILKSEVSERRRHNREIETIEREERAANREAIVDVTKDIIGAFVGAGRREY